MENENTVVDYGMNRFDKSRELNTSMTIAPTPQDELTKVNETLTR